MRALCLAFLAVLLLAGCSSKPQLYPNKKYNDVGAEAAKADTDDCMKKADAFLDSPRGKKIVKSAATGAVIGGVIGGVAGAFGGNVGRGAAVGAAMGGAGGAASGALSPDEVRQRFVNKCLSDKGYEVIGWD